MNALEIRQRLKDEQERAMHSALSAPAGQDGYAYGWACGFYAGLGTAIGVFDDILEEHAKVRRDL